MTARPEPLHLHGPLPGPGATVIEASAGTGKTYALTSLVARFVAEGVPFSSVLAVTFTRLATGELRERIRSRLIELHGALGEAAPDRSDPVLAALEEGGAEAASQRRRRLADALSDFDGSTIATTHGFCQLVLDGLGSAGDTAAGTRLLEDPSALVAQVVDDLYLRRSGLHGRPPFTLREARAAATKAVENAGTPVVPRHRDDPAGLLARLATKAREEVERTLLGEGLITYDQLLQRLAATLADPLRGPRAAARLAAQYAVVLVDEFQDTDPVQWDILRRAFVGGRTRLVLIGDPKQAIYAFRGADVYAYLEAARTAGRVWTLAENRRADQPLIDALDALMRPLQFGHADIVFRPVAAAPERDRPGLVGAPCPAPLRVRVVDDRQPGIRRTDAKGLLAVPDLTRWIAADAARDIARLLGSGATVAGPGGPVAVRPRDVAVLAATNAQVLEVRDALRQVGVAAVVAGLDSVFRSEAATAWLRLLEAIQEPASRSKVSALARTPFIGMDALDMATAGEDRWEPVHERVHRWSGLMARDGVAALFRALTRSEDLPGRILAVEGGERLLTDLSHVAALLHREAASSSLGAPSLRAWLSARMAAAGQEQSDAEERSRRLDSDAEAVQVLTVHRAKGLEFPIVYCPFLWYSRPENSTGPVVFHDPAQGWARTLDAGCPDRDGPAKGEYDGHARIARDERRGEDLRLLYVAVTRARHQVVVWWGRASGSRMSPLGRLLVSRDQSTGEVRPPQSAEPGGGQVRKSLAAIAEKAPGLIEVEAAGDAAEGRPPSPGGAAGSLDLVAARFERALDLTWRRSSYSSITAEAHGLDRGPAVGSEPEAPGLADEPDEPAAAAPLLAPGPPEGAIASPFNGIPGGAAAGTYVHALLERVDFTAADLTGEVVEAMAALDGAPPAPAAVLAPALATALSTPLGPLVEGVSLSAVGRPDRMDELSFELPVAGGDSPFGRVHLEQIATVLESHSGELGPVAGYQAQLQDPALAPSIRGYLTGSLDLVFRRPGPGGEPRWYLADYKTNHLGGDPATTAHYHPAALAAEMYRRHYPLQALLYLVALHRYLRWRQPGYRPERHLGGVLYLFLRGMAGPATPLAGGSPCGVFAWAPPAALVEDLSTLFDGNGR